jgi:hypothetical protein
MKGDGEYEFIMRECTFEILRRHDGDKWHLMYYVPIHRRKHGTYCYVICDTPEECCAISCAK